MSESLGHDARALIDQATQARGDEPTSADRERVRARLALAMVATTGGFAVAGTSKLAASGSLAPAAATPSVAAGAAGAVGAIGAALGTKIALVVALVGALGGGGAMILARRGAGATTNARPSPVVAAPVPGAPVDVPVAPVVAVAAMAPVVPSAPPAAAAAAAPAVAAAALPAPVTSAAAASSPPDVADELVLLREARSALNAGDPERSLHLLAEHARRYPHGALTEEREAARAVATCATVDAEARTAADARAAVARFFRVYPRSVHASRVRAACAALTASSSP